MVDKEIIIKELRELVRRTEAYLKVIGFERLLHQRIEENKVKHGAYMM
jgi:hypothetical protein